VKIAVSLMKVFDR